jgi:hypothetical protein
MGKALHCEKINSIIYLLNFIEMTHNLDWLPHNHGELYNLIGKTYFYVTHDPERERMGFAATTPNGKWVVDNLTPHYIKLQVAYLDWAEPETRTKASFVELETVEKAIVPLFRQFYTGMLKNNPLVTDTDLTLMGLPTRSEGRTPVPVPVTWPVGAPDTSTQRRVTIHFADSAHSESKAKPYGVHGAEIRWAVFDSLKEGVSLEELVESSFDTRSPFHLDFKEGDSGKLFYYALRWENTRGDKGPFSRIAHVFIP